jgi:hypothetical protein
MELTAITFKKGNLEITMEESSVGGYSIEILNKNDDVREPLAHFRTDEVMIEDLIDALTFARDYNFIQENEKNK